MQTQQQATSALRIWTVPDATYNTLSLSIRFLDYA